MKSNFRRLWNNSLILLTVSLIIGCEKGVIIKDTYDPKVVVLGEFRPDKLWEVQVSRSSSLNAVRSNLPIEDAIVNVNIRDSIVDILEYDQSSQNYQSTLNHYPEPETNYKVTVDVTGEKIITASDKAPKVSFVFVDSLFQMSRTPSFVELGFSISDVYRTEGYFHLSFFEKVYETVSGVESLISVKQISSLEINENDPDFENEPNTVGFKLINDMGYLYDDVNLNGTAKKKIYIRIPFDELEHDPQNNITSEISVELRSVSYTYFEFYKGVTEQLNSENPLAFQIPLYNNISEGVGIFAGYSLVCSQLKL